jgi:hypothetical protein
VQRADTRFGPISAISTAPIAIGNSVQGASARIRQTPTGVRVVGRDFALTGKGTGNVVTWTPMCGMPITPAAMPSTVLKQYNNMYGYYKVHSLVAHYITLPPRHQMVMWLCFIKTTMLVLCLISRPPVSYLTS